MSITTKIGDRGETRLMYNRKVAKSDLRIGTYGTVDELTSALGLVRARATTTGKPELAAEIATVQTELIGLMGELATSPEDLDRYHRDGHARVTDAEVARLTTAAAAIEAIGLRFDGWVIPGAAGNELAAALDFARTVARRAEREVVDLAESEPDFNEILIRYLNRLSDYLWLLARRLEQHP